jgi:hypothetical protein
MERQTSTPDATIEIVTEPYQAGDLCVETRSPAARKPRPILLGGGPARRQRCESVTNLFQAQPDLLSGADEGNPTQGRAVVSTLVARRSVRRDEALTLVEPQSGGCNTGTFRKLTDGYPRWQQQINSPKVEVNSMLQMLRPDRRRCP